MKCYLRSWMMSGIIGALGFSTVSWAQFPSDDRAVKQRPKHEEKAYTNRGEEEGKEPSSFFPPWGTPEFDWLLQPLIGARYERDADDTQTTTSTTSELGVRFALKGIPIVPGNWGLYLKPDVGYAAGTVNTVVNPQGASSTTTNASFSRLWYGNDFILYLGWYRHTLGVTRGEIKYSGDLTTKNESLQILNDFGVLVLPWLSLHETVRDLKYKNSKTRKSIIEETDNWLHARMAFRLLNFQLDFGPGFSTVKIYGYDAAGNHLKIGDGQTNYLLALSSFDLFWKLGMNAQAKYVYDAPQFNTTASKTVATERMPTQNVGDMSIVSTLPDDSLEANVFLGIRNLFAGLGVGWNYHMLTLHYKDQGVDKRQTYVDHGLSVAYQTNF